MADMRTPLNKVRGLGSAKSGTEHFWRIRLSSIALVPLALFVTGMAFSVSDAPYAEVRASLARPIIALIVGAFILLSLDHMRLGMQVIIEDYIHGEGARITLLALNIFFAVALGAVAIFSILKIAFGG
jgi:succinate dehydrogenase / fumarate reductase membrane anchor subunit